MSGYYVQTDFIILDVGGAVWVTDEEMQVARETMDTPFNRVMRGERLYWNGETKTMDGAVERATVYPTIEEAESQAFIASCLDPNLAGHVRIIAEADALKVEKDRIERRRVEAANAKLHQERRFKLGPKDGGI